MQTTSISFWWQARRLTKLLLIIYLPIVAILIVLAIQHRIPATIFFEDPAVYGEVPFYTGIISNIGVLLWTAAAVICWFTYYIARNTGIEWQLCAFVLSSALLTSFLALDDLFLLHDQVFPNYLNIPELVFFPAYAAAILAYLLRFRQIIVQSEYLLLVLALLFFVLSLVVDNFEHFTPDNLTQGMRSIAADNNIIATTDTNTSPLHALRLIAEDGAKFMGITAWAIYFIRFCWQMIVKMKKSPTPTV